MSYPFLKGHGTLNDFVLLPDHDGRTHGALDPERVRALCDRRGGIGGDGVLRVIRTAALAEDVPFDSAEAEWFMDYRNADGSLSEMCGNGVRVFARHLLDEGLATAPVAVGTRGGVKVVTLDGDELTVDMGLPLIGDDSWVRVGDVTWPATQVSMGNPHAVAFVGDLDEAGSLLAEPDYDAEVYPEGVNVEFVVDRAPGHVAMRVHERGSGETHSCGTGACAVAVATALRDGTDPRVTGEAVTSIVDLPGGRLRVRWDRDSLTLSGPAVVVARGDTDL